MTDVYRLCTADPKVGERRMRFWRCLIPPAGDADPQWAARCKEYWELQQRLYGLKMSDFHMAYLVEDGIGLMTTVSTVVAVLPGARIRGYTPEWLIEAKVQHNG